jgi:hypothetical protein
MLYREGFVCAIAAIGFVIIVSGRDAVSVGGARKFRPARSAYSAAENRIQDEKW